VTSISLVVHLSLLGSPLTNWNAACLIPLDVYIRHVDITVHLAAATWAMVRALRKVK
jgi:hypothetical protein